jgi:hypothetical protein
MHTSWALGGVKAATCWSAKGSIDEMAKRCDVMMSSGVVDEVNTRLAKESIEGSLVVAGGRW